MTQLLFDRIAPSLSTTARDSRRTEAKGVVLLSVAMKGQLIKKSRVGTEAQQNAQIFSKQSSI